MSQENLQTMIMQNSSGGGVKEVYYGTVQVVNPEAPALNRLTHQFSSQVKTSHIGIIC